MKLGKQKGHDSVITVAGKMYDDSVKMFSDARAKIQSANEQLEMTIEEITAEIAALEGIRDKAIQDKERNNSFDEKLAAFTSQ